MRERLTQKPLIGLIGGIGSGKSLVAGLLAEKGGQVIEADKLGHEALRQPHIRQQVVERWGGHLLDASGEVVRRRLGAIVFADANERRALERLVFPWIEERIQAELTRLDSRPEVEFIVLDAAVMIEAGWDRFCDLVVFVDTARPERLLRLDRQRGWKESDVNARERAQLPLDEKKSRAHVVVDNSGDPARTRDQVERLFRKLPSQLGLPPSE